MSRLRDGLAVLLAFAVPCTHVVLGVFIALLLMPQDAPFADSAMPNGNTSRIQLSDHGGKVRATVVVATGEASTEVALETESGRRLANLIVFQNGSMTLESVRSDPTRFALHRDSHGSISLGVANHPQVGLVLDARTEGTSKFVVRRLEDGSDVRVLRVGPESEF